jgi:hypothetical protein
MSLIKILRLKYSNLDSRYLRKANNLSEVDSPNAALNNVLPTQVGNANKALVTDGTNASWEGSVITGTTWTGEFTTADDPPKTVSVVNGIITSAS